MKKMLEYDRIDFSGGIKIKQGIKEGIKQAHQKNLIFVTAGILKILVLSMSHIFAMVVMIWWKELRVLMMLLLFSAYRIHFWYMSKDAAISIMSSSNLVDQKGVLQYFIVYKKWVSATHSTWLIIKETET